MGGKSSRTKGQAGEREICKILGEALGISLERNLEQTRDGGCDIRLRHWAIEVKRQEKLQVDKWWEQAVSQAEKCEKHPILIFRQSRMPWRVIMPVALTQDPRIHYMHTDLDYLIERIKS
jgi:Holliday junction resolvase